MKEIESFVKSIVSDLPMNDQEKEDLKEELISHLNEHVKELIIKGHSKDEAVIHAIQSFGSENELNWEIKKAIFPLYKVIRYLWNVVFVTVILCIASYSIMEYYHPEFDNSLPIYSIVTEMLLVAIIAGVVEIFYEAFISVSKSKYFTNPWFFFLVPTLLLGILLSFSLLNNPGNYKEGLWADLFAIPIGALAYIISRQLFTSLFVRNKNEYKRTTVK
ncbi:permease prefix domain 1-containing protein [Neobacillus sp. LXY-4]|uniref:permease prefix domain 1-containing protein n=1 Tax=Neobacillus sp. LXY-4 TaxID=3379826 RepID=UPI003EE094AF